MDLQFTATEASVVTGLALKAVHKAIDLRTIPSVTTKRDGATKRFVSEMGLVCLRLEAQGLGELPLRFRRRIFALVLAQPEVGTVRPVEAMQIDVQGAHREVLRSVGELRRAEEMVRIDPEVMGGVPVVAGTRIPVHGLGEMLAAGATAEEIAEGYPTLSAEQVRLAAIYVAAHPRRGRPAARVPEQPWKERAVRITETMFPAECSGGR